MTARDNNSRAASADAICARGIARLWDRRVWGTLIGALAGTVFVLANREPLGDPWSGIALVAWLVALAGYVSVVLLVRRDFPAAPPVARSAGLVCLGSVAGMLLLIAVGSAVLSATERQRLRPALIVLAVGLHFVPFASAFRTPLFSSLGTVMTALGVVGVVVGWLWVSTAAAITAVIAGLVMLVFITGDAAAARRRT